MRSAVFLLAACLSLSGMLAAAPLAASVPSTQEIAALGNLDTAPSKAAKPTKAKASKATKVESAGENDLVTNSPEGASGTAREAPSAGSGGDALQASSGTQSAPPHVIPEGQPPADAVAQIAEPEPNSGAPAPSDVAIAGGGADNPAPETGEVEEADAAAASEAAIGLVMDAERNPPERLADGKITLTLAAELKPAHLVVIGPADGRRRAGHRFGPTPMLLETADLTTDQFVALYSDPLLTIRLG